MFTANLVLLDWLHKDKASFLIFFRLSSSTDPTLSQYLSEGSRSSDVHTSGKSSTVPRDLSKEFSRSQYAERSSVPSLSQYMDSRASDISTSQWDSQSGGNLTSEAEYTGPVTSQRPREVIQRSTEVTERSHKVDSAGKVTEAARQESYWVSQVGVGLFFHIILVHRLRGLLISKAFCKWYDLNMMTCKTSSVLFISGKIVVHTNSVWNLEKLWSMIWWSTEV